MAEPTVLELIARKEQELRVQLMAARAEADALVADARTEAADLRAAENAAAAQDAQDWLNQELTRARNEVEQMVSAATDAMGKLGDPGPRRQEAVQHVLDEILLRSPLTES